MAIDDGIAVQDLDYAKLKTQLEKDGQRLAWRDQPSAANDAVSTDDAQPSAVVIDVPVVVEEDGDLPVPLHAGHGLYDDSLVVLRDHRLTSVVLDQLVRQF